MECNADGDKAMKPHQYIKTVVAENIHNDHSRRVSIHQIYKEHTDNVDRLAIIISNITVKHLQFLLINDQNVYRQFLQLVKDSIRD